MLGSGVPDRIWRWLAWMRGAGRAGGTMNAYARDAYESVAWLVGEAKLGALRGFSKYLVRAKVDGIGFGANHADGATPRAARGEGKELTRLILDGAKAEDADPLQRLGQAMERSGVARSA